MHDGIMVFFAYAFQFKEKNAGGGNCCPPDGLRKNTYRGETLKIKCKNKQMPKK
jgi:hypothetical protein